MKNSVFATAKTGLAALVLVLVWLDFTRYLCAQGDEYPYQRYADRKEGVLNIKELVAGEKLELISAAITQHEAQSQAQLGQYHLAFFMQDSSRVQVIVQAHVPEIHRLYRMEPIFMTPLKGVRTFTWPATIPRHYNLDVDKLLPLAKVKGVGGGKIAPVLLYSQNQKDATPRYRFCVVPNGTISVLNYHVYGSNATTPIYSATLRDLQDEQQAFLTWEGRHQDGVPVKNGWYKLIIEATFKALPGANPRKVSAQYEFYHYTDIFRSAGAVK